MEFGRITNRDTIEAFLRRDVESHVYGLADLDDFFWPETVWYGASEAGELAAICMILDKLRIPIVYAVCPEGDRAASALLHSLRGALPDRFFVNVGPGLDAALGADFRFESHGTHLKMLLTERQSLARVDTQTTQPLDASHLGELQDFLAHRAYTADEAAGRFFEPYMLDWGFFGIRDD